MASCIPIALVCLVASACVHKGERPIVAAGRALAERHCATCHTVADRRPSPLADAPAFRDLPARFPVRRFTRAYRNGLFENHPRMPIVELGPDQLTQLSAFLTSLSNRAR